MKINITREQALLIRTACDLAKYDSDSEDDYEISFNKKLDEMIALMKKAIREDAK